METCSVILTFESVAEILWCDHSNETSSAVLLHGTITFLIFYEMEFGIFLEFFSLALLEVKLRIKRKFLKVVKLIHVATTLDPKSLEQACCCPCLLKCFLFSYFV